MKNLVPSIADPTGPDNLSTTTTAAAAAPSMGTPATRPLTAGLSALAGHARIIALARPAESGAALFSTRSAPGGAIQVLVPPFACGATFSPVKVCSAAALATSVPLAGHVFAALPIK